MEVHHYSDPGNLITIITITASAYFFYSSSQKQKKIN